jgi:uncharacterized protein (UPF0276 family)
MSVVRRTASAAGPIPAAAGIGLRFPHHRAMLDQPRPVAWLEAHAENYMSGGLARAQLRQLRRDHPVSLHAVGLSLGSADGIDSRHLDRLADLVAEVEPGLVSDHLAWSAIGGTYLGDLLPLPLTEATLATVSDNVSRVQSRLRRRILVENPSTYLRFRHSTIPEWDFLARLVQHTGCGLLCDVNNIAVSAGNHGLDPMAWLDALPVDAVQEIHVAGHSLRPLDGGGTIRIDDHASRVSPAVWDLLRRALDRFGPQPVLVEWDADIPPLDVLLDEAATAQQCLDRAWEAQDARTC